MIATMLYGLNALGLSILAQDAPPATPAPERGAGGFPSEFVFIMLAVFAIFYFLVMRPQRSRERQRKDMLAALRKGDKIMTIGGVIGTVVNIRDTEVTVKVDESSNTRVTFARSAIDRVLASREGTPQEKE